MGKLFLVMGKSATGKDHIYRAVLDCFMQTDMVNNKGTGEPLSGTDRGADTDNKNIVLKSVVSYTTRPKRIRETDGKEYHFVTEDRMKELEKAGRIIEKRVYHTVYGDWYYFTCDDGQIDIETPELNNILIVTPEAYAGIRAYFGDKVVRPIYIEIDDGERLKRAMKREAKQEKPAYAEMCRRFLADEKDFSEEVLDGLGIKKRFINDNFNMCVAEIAEYVRSQCEV